MQGMLLKPTELNIRKYSYQLMDMDSFLPYSPGDNESENITEEKINDTILHSVQYSWAKQDTMLGLKF